MGLFSFLHKKTDKTEFELTEPVEQKYIISGTQRDYSNVKGQDVALKIWLPEVVKVSLEEMASYANTSISDFVIQTLFTYLYGRYDLMSSIEKGERDFALNGQVKFSKQAPLIDDDLPKVDVKNRTPELGKSTYDVKVWIAAQMKDDLQKLADKTDLKLSHFIREILISNLFGHTYLPEREEMLKIKIKLETKEE